MKKKLKDFALCIVFLLILVIVLGKVCRLVERKESYIKNKDFLEEKENIDVLFLGNSHMLNGVFPMVLWNDYGIVSYNLANHSEHIAENYWTLRLALEYTEPKLVVVDMASIGTDSKIGKWRGTEELYTEYLHDGIDAYPLSLIKLQEIWDILPPKERFPFLFDFSLYHTRWNELGEEDWNPDISTQKGASMRVRVEKTQKAEIIPKEQSRDEWNISKEYLVKIIELCREREIELLFVNIPYGKISVEKQEWANSVYAISKKYDINYINFFYSDLDINYMTDCSDADSHLNPAGGKKVTGYLGDYMINNYDITDRREEEAYSHWWEDYEEYVQEYITRIQNRENFYEYLLLLNDENLSCDYYINGDSAIFQDELAVELWNNIESKEKMERLPEGVETDIYIVVKDRETGEVLDTASFEVQETGYLRK